MKREINKSGVSAVVTTVLIIMITVAAVGIIWAVIIPMIRDNLGSSVVCNDADVSIGTSQGYTCYDAAQKVVAVQAVKGVNEINVSGLKFLISSSGSSVSYSTDFVFEKGASKTFYINTSTLASVDQISLVPILTDGKKSKECSKVSLNTIPSCNLGTVIPDFYIETFEQRQVRCSSFNSEISCQNAKCKWNVDANCEGSFGCDSGGSGCDSIAGCDWYYPESCRWKESAFYYCSDFNLDESECSMRPNCIWMGEGCSVNMREDLCTDISQSECSKYSSFCEWYVDSSNSQCVGTPISNCDSAISKSACDDFTASYGGCYWRDNSYCSA